MRAHKRTMGVTIAQGAGLLVASALALGSVGAANAHSPSPLSIELTPRRVAATAAASAPVRAARFAASSAATSQRLAAGERHAWLFLKDIAASHRLQLEAARLMQLRGSDPRLLALAGHMLGLHEQLDIDLLRLQHVRGMAPPMLETHQRKQLSQLGKARGAAVNRLFAELAVQATREDWQAFERGLQGIDDATLRAWITRQLPAVRELAQQAQQAHAPRAVGKASR